MLRKRISIVDAILTASPPAVTPCTADQSTTIRPTARKKINTDPSTAALTRRHHMTTTTPVALSDDEASAPSRSIRTDLPSLLHHLRRETMRQATRLSTTPRKATRFLRLSVTAIMDRAEIMEVTWKFCESLPKTNGEIIFS